jgi:hypothetical protein
MSFAIKIIYKESQDIRRVSLDDCTFAALTSALSALKPNENNYTIKYCDPEGDLLTIGSDMELVEAFRVFKESGKTLKVEVSACQPKEDVVPSKQSGQSSAAFPFKFEVPASQPQEEAAPSRQSSATASPTSPTSPAGQFSAAASPALPASLQSAEAAPFEVRLPSPAREVQSVAGNVTEKSTAEPAPRKEKEEAPSDQASTTKEEHDKVPKQGESEVFPDGDELLQLMLAFFTDDKVQEALPKVMELAFTAAEKKESARSVLDALLASVAIAEHPSVERMLVFLPFVDFGALDE